MSTLTTITTICDRCQRSCHTRPAQSVVQFYLPGAPLVDLCVDCAALGYTICKQCYTIHLADEECTKQLLIIEDVPVWIDLATG